MKTQQLQKKVFHLDPRTKLLLMAIISTSEFLYSHVAFMITVALIPFVLLMINKQYKIAIGFIVLFSLSLIAKETQSFIHFNLLFNMIIVLLLALVLRLFPAFAMGAYIIYSTKASEFISSMERMHVTRKITIPVSVLFRFLPTMREEATYIKDAMRMREIQLGSKKFWKNPMALVEYRFIPLMISVVKIGEELSAASLTKGIDNPGTRTNIAKIGFTMYDVITLCITIVGLLTSFFIFK
ncbi:energy-coupling factor transporter transmembrane component T [Clostridium sp. MB40-C1]|uniref:energy-coupling factor transporter transmembrane component T n=1 Tax=Clostridium sp. MB40-C1 TaxID=3070996 RepID=UPI0027DFDE1C|nr:energy-coupling factor transporter transmembrane component T [Clostridium sp. MB40-C1]WMJ81567.1 energy-coupling factor transporter transmembrane component T [Clostridium sp. MB40-C1]